MSRPIADPIFIGGPDRSGKTLLAAILGSHPRIAIPAVGSNMWTFFYGRFGDLAVDRNAERCLEAMLAYKHVRYLQPDGERIRREFLAGERSYARLFALFHEQHAERLGKPRWGDQTGLVERYADEIFAAYPAARMIHMVRDPRDRYEASLSLWPEGRLRVGGAVARWLVSTGLALRNARRYPERYLVLTYEELVRSPEATARRVCAFVGEPFVPAMLEMGDLPLYRAKLERSVAGLADGRGEGSSPISSAFVGQWRGRIPARELAFLQAWAGRRMRAFGYPLEPVRLGLLERLRYVALDWPVNGARMAFWLAREAIHQRFPRWLGRTPRPRMRVGSEPA
ncbi:MAG TPA: sulfotransferase [Candidatus Limnocylindrales bacterium]|nr:sulfotransferase [Candidatus Limnocylindrales bacterium]